MPERTSASSGDPQLHRRRRRARLGRLVHTFAIVGAFSVLVVLFVQMPAGKALVNRARLVALPTSERAPEPPIQAQAPSVVEAPGPPSPSALQTKRQQASPESVPPVRPESVREPANTAPTPRPHVTPPAPPRPVIVASPEPTGPRSSEDSTPRTAHTASPG